MITGHQFDGSDVVLYDQEEAIRQPNRDDGLGRQARHVIAAACDSPAADAHTHRHTTGGRKPADGWIFTQTAATWAYLSAEELWGPRDRLAGAS